jgi:hypothetical protein
VSRTVVLSATVIVALVAACMAAVVVASVSQKAEAAFPGRNGDIAFERRNSQGVPPPHIYRMRADGTQQRRLTDPEPPSSEPSFIPPSEAPAYSADGKHMMESTLPSRASPLRAATGLPGTSG